MVSFIYPPELTLNKTDGSDTDVSFLVDLNLPIVDSNIISDIHNTLVREMILTLTSSRLDGDIHLTTSYVVHISLLMRFPMELSIAMPIIQWSQ